MDSLDVCDHFEHMVKPRSRLDPISSDIEKAVNFAGWSSGTFMFQFILSCLMGFVLMYSVVLCTQHNSSLTTTVVGCLKNLMVTYVGMAIGGDYIFSYLNFFGINISVMGSLVYSYVAFKFDAKKKLPPPVLKA